MDLNLPDDYSLVKSDGTRRPWGRRYRVHGVSLPADWIIDCMGHMRDNG
jgi:hypothetical protein